MTVMTGDSLKAEVWNRLTKGESLNGLSLPRKAGRIDLSGFLLADPKIVNSWQTPLANITQIEPTTLFRQAKLQDLDFTGGKAKLPSLC